VNKNGQVDSGFLIKTTLTILGFVLILVVVYNSLDLSRVSEDQLCHLSVLTRATSPDALQAYIPLNCDTKKICLGGECEKNLAGESFDSLDLDNSNVKAAKEVEKVIADEMLRCWEVMGEGKLDIYESASKSVALGGEGVVDPICNICARIVVDDERLLKKQGEKEKTIYDDVNVVTYLANNNPEGSDETYFELFSDGVTESYADVDRVYKQGDRVDDLKDKNEVAIVFMQIKSKEISSTLSTLGKGGLAGVGISFMTAPKLTLRVLTAAPLLSFFTATSIGGISSLNAHLGQGVAAGYCGEFTTNAKGGAGGCSVIRAVPYEFGEINRLCKGGIEGRL
jgi:hypothetical protein